MRVGDPRQRAGALRRQRPGPAHVDIEPALGRRYLDVERFGRAAERFRQRPGGLNRAAERWREHRTLIDRHDVMGAKCRKADRKHVHLAAPRMERRAAPPRAVRVDELVYRCLKPALLQRRDHKAVLPGAIAREIPMLGLAAAAGAEMRTDRRDTLGTWRLDAQQMAAVRMALHPVDFDRFTGQRAWHEHGTIGRIRNAVAAMPDARNLEV